MAQAKQCKKTRRKCGGGHIVVETNKKRLQTISTPKQLMVCAPDAKMGGPSVSLQYIYIYIRLKVEVQSAEHLRSFVRRRNKQINKDYHEEYL